MDCAKTRQSAYTLVAPIFGCTGDVTYGNIGVTQPHKGDSAHMPETGMVPRLRPPPGLARSVLEPICARADGSGRKRDGHPASTDEFAIARARAPRPPMAAGRIVIIDIGRVS